MLTSENTHPTHPAQVQRVITGQWTHRQEQGFIGLKAIPAAETEMWRWLCRRDQEEGTKLRKPAE